MSIEAGARAGMIAPDATTFAYLSGWERAPAGAGWDRAVQRWAELGTDPGAVYDELVVIDAGSLGFRSYGVPTGIPLEGLKVDRVFVGSCTNGRIENLRDAAKVAHGRRVADGVRVMVVPRSQRVKAAVEREGLDRIFLAAGFEWRNSGCSLSLGMNDDTLARAERCASTSNRNLEGRQGRGSRTHLVSPAMAAAAAVSRYLVDVRGLMQ